MQDFNKDFKDYIETLPPELKQAVYSIDYPQKLQQVVKNNKLILKAKKVISPKPSIK